MSRKRVYHNHEKIIRNIFDNEPELEISVKGILYKITNDCDPPQTIYNSVCRTIRKLESGNEPYLESKFFYIKGARVHIPDENFFPSRIKMIRLNSIGKQKRHWNTDTSKRNWWFYHAYPHIPKE